MSACSAALCRVNTQSQIESDHFRGSLEPSCLKPQITPQGASPLLLNLCAHRTPTYLDDRTQNDRTREFDVVMKSKLCRHGPDSDSGVHAATARSTDYEPRFSRVSRSLGCFCESRRYSISLAADFARIIRTRASLSFSLHKGSSGTRESTTAKFSKLLY
jgi:hypothetical protein